MRRRERGYALVFVFALASVIALALYIEMPRLALEMQRNREDTLIQRGEQYSLAIRRFVRANSKFPQTIEELESYNGKRFLRRRYADPLTGKDEWRLIHVDGSGRFTDSLTQKQTAGIPGAPGQTAEAAQPQQNPTFSVVTGGVPVAPGDPNANPQVAAALRRRDSELPGAAGAPPPPGQTAPGQPVDANIDPNNPNAQSQPPPPPPSPPGMLIGPNGQPIRPIQIPGLPGPYQGPYPTQPANSQAGGIPPQAVGGASNSFAQPGGLPPGINANPAAALIQQMLTTPNPRGLQQAGLGGGQTLGGGIAGVASKVDAEGIKIYNEKTNYKEWEFLYDPSKDKTRAGGAAGQGQIPQVPIQPGQFPPQQQPGQPPPGLPSQLPGLIRR